jgi:hypothetical protein
MGEKMSKIKRYIAFCEENENGYTNEEGEVDSMEYAEEYMKTQQYAKEHDKQTIKVAKNNENSQHKQSVLW